jgi:uncharacterized protein YndB with AHSA1/START domain
MKKEMNMAIEKNNVVVVEHEFAVPVAKVFAALKEGRLFFNCGAWPEETKVDFRTGGKYLLNFAHYGKTYGEFLEIAENKRVVFTWESDDMEVKGTRVSIDLAPSARGCKLKLKHEGFTDLETAKGHEGGWTCGLKSMDDEATKYLVHIEREFVAPVAMLYQACSGTSFMKFLSPKTLNVDFRVGGRYHGTFEKGEIRGEILEIEKDKKIKFTWESSCGGALEKPSTVTMEFGPWGDDGKNSYIELLHEGLTTEEQALSHHEGWNELIWNTYKKVCR